MYSIRSSATGEITQLEFGASGEDPNALCPTIEDMGDGPGRRLWKQSDHTGVVALFTPRDGYTAKRVRVMYQGEFTEELEYSGLGNPDPEGLRTHWRNRYKNASEFPPGIVLVVSANGGQTFCYRIDTPSKRVD